MSIVTIATETTTGTIRTSRWTLWRRCGCQWRMLCKGAEEPVECDLESASICTRVIVTIIIWLTNLRRRSTWYLSKGSFCDAKFCPCLPHLARRPFSVSGADFLLFVRNVLVSIVSFSNQSCFFRSEPVVRGKKVALLVKIFIYLLLKYIVVCSASALERRHSEN